jgi:hypothetical protein
MYGAPPHPGLKPAKVLLQCNNHNPLISSILQLLFALRHKACGYAGRN